MASRYHWYVPAWGMARLNWQLDPSDLSTYGQSLELIVPDGPGADELYEASVRVTRIVGQYRMRIVDADSMTTGGGVGPTTVHHRVYPVSGDGTNFFLRFLHEVEDADSDFMWHQIDELPTEYYQAMGGVPTAVAAAGWYAVDQNAPSVAMQPFQHGRFGHVDIKVDRTIDEGEALIWRTQFDPGGSLPFSAATDVTCQLDLWLRMLIHVKI